MFFSKEKFTNFVNKHFSFDGDINLSDETEVLFRRNIVIKNIIFLSNIVYSIFLFVLTFGSKVPGEWLFSVIPFPITFLMNRTTKKVIHQYKTSLIHQQAAMYMSTFYMFLSAAIIYIKLAVGADAHLATAGYMLIYYSLIVVSLYQNRAMLKRVFLWMLPIVTALHVFITHQLHNQEYSTDVFSFLKEFFTTPEFRDIAFRTVVMGCFMIAVYTICVIGEKMSQARKTELEKRHEIQSDFTKIVTNLFDVLIQSSVNVEGDELKDKIFYDMTYRLSSIVGKSPQDSTEIAEYALFLSKHKSDFKLEVSDSDEDNFEFLRNQSELGTQLVKRIELAQKCETIMRTYVEGNSSPSFSNTMNKIQRSDTSDIILLVDIYITLRDHKTYKRPHSHELAIREISDIFNIYFPSALVDRFVKFHSDFNVIYEAEDSYGLQ